MNTSSTCRRPSQLTHRLVHNNKPLLFWNGLLLSNNYIIHHYSSVMQYSSLSSTMSQDSKASVRETETNAFWTPTMYQGHGSIMSSWPHYKMMTVISILQLRKLRLRKEEQWTRSQPEEPEFLWEMPLSPHYSWGSRCDPEFKRLTCIIFTLSLKIFM